MEEVTRRRDNIGDDKSGCSHGGNPNHYQGCPQAQLGNWRGTCFGRTIKSMGATSSVGLIGQDWEVTL